jgi:hypothetical protein
MTNEAKKLARAILSRIREREGSANKTKLLKLLYLADLENYRAEGRTITGFDWIFFHYGPWAAEYDALLDQLTAEHAIEADKWASSDLEGVSLRIAQPASLGELIKSTTALLRVQRYIDIWADRSVPSLLDYVYFETEPMSGADKGDKLDFAKIHKDPPLMYRRKPSGEEQGKITALRRKFSARRTALDDQREKAQKQFTEGPHDQIFIDAIATLNTDDL